MKITIKKLEKSEVEILGVIEASDFTKHEEKALLAIGERLELPGFRKGKAPASKIKEKVPEMELLEEMAEHAISKAYPKILKENKIDAIGRPQITITKIAKGADLEFKIVSAILPKMELPDYKKIAKTEASKEEFKKKIIVEEAEVEKIILDLRKMRAEQLASSVNKSASSKDNPQTKDEHASHENITEKAHTKAHSVKAIDKKEPVSLVNKIPESEYPELNDELVKSFGKFKTVDEFKEKIRENIKIEKETQQKDKVRMTIVEEVVKQTGGEIPEILIKGETDKMLYKLQADIAQAGLKFEDYLKQIKKTEEELRKEWKTDAEKRAKLQMIIQTISKKENLKPTEEEIKKDVENITKMYKDADPARARAYVEQMLENEKVFNFLEKQ